MTGNGIQYFDLDLIGQAVGECQLAFSLVDVHAEDRPIIYANKAFEKLTLYPQEEILGRNCRFMQGNDRDQTGRRVVSEAVSRGKACRTVLRNYKKDGTKFLTELRLSPLSLDGYTVTHFVGCQTELDFPNLFALRDEALMKMSDITQREREMFSHLVKGESTKGAARYLDISPRTAEKHRQNLLRKLGVANAVELVNLTIRTGEANLIGA